MSDSWYRDPVKLPPFVDGFGRRWLLDGTCLDVEPEPPAWISEWPEDLRYAAIQAAFVMDVFDTYRNAVRQEIDAMFGPR